jgi:hypothetical protein
LSTTQEERSQALIRAFELTSILRKNSLTRPTVMGGKKLGHMMVGRLNKTEKREK